MTNSKVLGRRYTDMLNHHGAYGLELTDFKCVGRKRSVRKDEKRCYTYIKVPGPTVKRAWGVKIEQQEDFSWLNSLTFGPHSRVGDVNPWKHHCATSFVECLLKAESVLKMQARSVWFFACPLQSTTWSGTWGTFCHHWGVVVSRRTRRQIEALKNGQALPPNQGRFWGTLFELRESNGFVRYVRTGFTADHFRQRGTILEYIGQTDMSDSDIDYFGIYYFLGSANVARERLFKREPVLPST